MAEETKIVEVTTEAQLDALLVEGKTTLIDMWAPWCGPCKMQTPILEKVAVVCDESINIVKVNVDQNQELAAQFGVRSIPALFFIKNGEIVESLNGVQSESSLDKKIHQHTGAVNH